MCRSPRNSKLLEYNVAFMLLKYTATKHLLYSTKICQKFKINKNFSRKNVPRKTD